MSKNDFYTFKYKIAYEFVSQKARILSRIRVQKDYSGSESNQSKKSGSESGI
jgi:hypothetical protein